MQKIYREGLEIKMIRTSPVSPVNRNERRMAIAKMIAVGESPCWTIAVVSIDWMDWLVEVSCWDMGEFPFVLGCSNSCKPFQFCRSEKVRKSNVIIKSN